MPLWANKGMYQLRRRVPISRASSGFTKNGKSYYFHSIWNNFSQTWTHCVLSKDIVEESEYRKYLLMVGNTPQECREWVENQE